MPEGHRRRRRAASWTAASEADVAGLRDQPAAQAGGEVLDAGMALADMGEAVGEAGVRIERNRYAVSLG